MTVVNTLSRLAAPEGSDGQAAAHQIRGGFMRANVDTVALGTGHAVDVRGGRHRPHAASTAGLDGWRVKLPALRFT